MQEKSESFKFGYYFDLVLRRRWFIIFPFCIALVVGIYLVLTLPKIYEASTLILVRPQKVPTNYVQSIVTSDINARINTISQQILSRTFLEKIINQFNLFLDPGRADMFLEDKASNLRKRIKVDVTRTKRGADALLISFRGQDPEKTMRVANGLATFFLDENMKVRETQAIGTSDFLDTELETMRKRLEAVEGHLRQYRVAHMGELPDQLETNLRMLDRLQMQLNERQESVRNAKNRVIMLDNQIKTTRAQYESSFQIPAENGQADPAAGNPVWNLARLKEELAVLLTNYTDQHPDVMRLKNRIAELEAKLNSGEISAHGSPPPVSKNSSAQWTGSGPYAELVRQKSEIKYEIMSLERDIAKLNRQIKDYQQRVEATPTHEQALLGLQRDYDNMQQSYNSLLNRKLEAEIALNMEKKQQGERFQIVDRAQLPRRPVSPDMRRLFLMVVAAGLGFGGGLVFLLDFLDSSLRRPEEFEPELGVPVLATIPKIYHPKDIRRQRFNLVLTTFSVILAVCLLAGFAALAFNGVESTMQLVGRFVKI